MIEFLIHLLGGYTKHDCDVKAVDFYYAGEHVVLSALKNEMDEMYGCSEGCWCNTIYNSVCNRIKHLEGNGI